EEHVHREPRDEPEHGPGLGPVVVRDRDNDHEADLGGDAEEAQMREQRGLKDHRPEDHQRQPDPSDHGVRCPDQKSTFTTLSRSGSTTGRSVAARLPSAPGFVTRSTTATGIPPGNTSERPEVTTSCPRLMAVPTCTNVSSS